MVSVGDTFNELYGNDKSKKRKGKGNNRMIPASYHCEKYLYDGLFNESSLKRKVTNSVELLCNMFSFIDSQIIFKKKFF